MPRAIFFLFIFALSVTAYTVDGESRKSKELLKSKVSKPDCQKVTDGLGCTCPVCKEVVQFTRMMILDHVPSEEQVLDKVCYRIFASDPKKKDFCVDLIRTELPDIVKYVRNHVDPNKCCSKFC